MCAHHPLTHFTCAPPEPDWLRPLPHRYKLLPLFVEPLTPFDPGNMIKNLLRTEDGRKSLCFPCFFTYKMKSRRHKRALFCGNRGKIDPDKRRFYVNKKPGENGETSEAMEGDESHQSHSTKSPMVQRAATFFLVRTHKTPLLFLSCGAFKSRLKEFPPRLF